MFYLKVLVWAAGTRGAQAGSRKVLILAPEGKGAPVRWSLVT